MPFKCIIKFIESKVLLSCTWERVDLWPYAINVPMFLLLIYVYKSKCLNIKILTMQSAKCNSLEKKIRSKFPFDVTILKRGTFLQLLFRNARITFPTILSLNMPLTAFSEFL